MAMLEYNEIKERKYIVLDGAPHEVVSSHVFRKQQRKPVNNAKLKNLITGKVLERSFHQSEKAEVADIDEKEIKYLYTNRGEFWFCDADNPKNRFQLTEEVIGDQSRFMKENMVVKGLLFDDQVIGIKFPIKIELAVTEAPPAVRGNTAQGGTKLVTLETGAQLTVPLFVNEGDILRINTETGEYTERAEKK